MTPSALIFGSIGAVAETSDIQRRAFNAAFGAADLEWEWSEKAYRDMLQKPGGRNRIADFAASRGEDVDADAIHDAKVEIFEQMVQDEGIVPRAGVIEVIAAARDAGMVLGWATSTTPRTVALMLSGLFPALPRSVFDFIGDATMVDRSKPAPDIYVRALQDLNVAPQDAIAIEDTPEAAQAARAAGLLTLGYANALAQGRAFPEGVRVVDELRVEDVLVQKTAA